MKKFCFLFAVTIVFVACDKDSAPPQSIPDTAENRLRTMQIGSLPSPWYALTYNNEGYITHVSHASGDRDLDVFYRNGQISHMLSTHPINHDSIAYNYTNGKLNVITLYDEARISFQRCFIDYDQLGRISVMEWERKQAAGFVADRTLLFSYNATGNLATRTEQRMAIPNQQTAATFTDTYSDYDTKKNAESLTVIHDGTGSLVLLPAARFRNNNPGRVVRSGTGSSYEIDFSYTYNDNDLPTGRTGIMRITSGNGTGDIINLTASYSYF